VLAACAFLAACGFHPRGAVELPSGLSTVYVQAPNTLIAEPLEMYLQAGGARLAASAAAADVTVVVSNESTSRRLLAVDPRTGKAREFQLAYALTYQANRADGSAMIPPQTVRLTRDYTFDPTAVIAKSEEETLIYSEMRRDAVQQVLRRLRVAVRGESPAHADQP
jgi:LPS-assembly lipoprotein